MCDDNQGCTGVMQILPGFSPNDFITSNTVANENNAIESSIENIADESNIFSICDPSGCLGYHFGQTQTIILGVVVDQSKFESIFSIFLVVV
ncbi:MAG: hypothetical protein KF888_00815 [Nitrosomonas sp.]|nr:hypothetical protein [Nitrosomonas sp.]